MKFNCGPTWTKKITVNDELRMHWHKWFALIPRRVSDEECRWLEYIERKGETYIGICFGSTPAIKVRKWRYEYRVLAK